MVLWYVCTYVHVLLYNVAQLLACIVWYFHCKWQRCKFDRSSDRVISYKNDPLFISLQSLLSLFITTLLLRLKRYAIIYVLKCWYCIYTYTHGAYTCTCACVHIQLAYFSPPLCLCCHVNAVIQWITWCFHWYPYPPTSHAAGRRNYGDTFNSL